MTPKTSSQVRDIADDVWAYRLRTQPLLRVRRGLPVEGLRGFGLDVLVEDARFAEQVLARLDGAGAASSHDDALTASFLRHVAELAVEAPDHYWHSIPITPYQIGLWLSQLGQHVFLPFRFDADEGGHADAVDRYLHLVADLAKLVQETGDKIEGQVERRIVLPLPALASARATLQALAASAAQLLVPAADRLAVLGPAADTATDRIEALVSGELSAAFTRLHDLVGSDYEKQSPDDVGVGQYDGGYDYYRYAVRERNTVDLEPERIHAIGLEEVAALAERMHEQRSEIGFSGTEAEFHEQLLREPRLYAATPEEVEDRYRGYMARLAPRLADFFSVLPDAPYDVRRLEPELEATMTYGYYQPPTPDSPVGLYRYNASQLDQRSLLNAAAIIYHELAPGHHFHIARQSENDALPDVRRETIELGAFNEGWAEYASGVAWEMGLYDDPLERYGRLAHERFMAQRLVVDTGMNVLGWSLDKGRAYMREHTLESEVQIATETLRYSTDLPAQALGYRLGHRAIGAARERAEEALGDSFDLRSFHEAILGAGALPLPVLDEHVDWFVEQERHVLSDLRKGQR